VKVDETFSISTEARDRVQLIVVRGELDELTAPELDAAIDGSRADSTVIVDLSNIVFISSAGIHVLLRDRSVQVALVCPPGNIMRLFEIVRANRRVPIFPSLSAALASARVPHAA
jgi:anti-anti-sigma factor